MVVYGSLEEPPGFEIDLDFSWRRNQLSGDKPPKERATKSSSKNQNSESINPHPNKIPIEQFHKMFA